MSRVLGGGPVAALVVAGRRAGGQAIRAATSVSRQQVELDDADRGDGSAEALLEGCLQLGGSQIRGPALDGECRPKTSLESVARGHKDQGDEASRAGSPPMTCLASSRASEAK